MGINIIMITVVAFMLAHYRLVASSDLYYTVIILLISHVSV